MCSKNAKPWSITVRLTFFYMLSASVTLFSIGWYLYLALADTFFQDNRLFLVKEIQLLHGVLLERPPNLPRLADEQGEGLDLPVGRYYSRILDDGGQSLIETPGMELLTQSISFPPAADITAANAILSEIPDGRTFMLLSVRDSAGLPQTIQIALDISHEAVLLAKFQRNLIAALCLGLLFSCLAAVLVARRGLNPIAEMTRHAEGITATLLHERLDPADWPEELSALAFAFNAMLMRLGKSFAQLNQFSADLAHELRTPINNLMGETEVALSRPRDVVEYREILASSLEEYGRLSRTVETLLFLARAENTEIPLRTARLDGRLELEAVRGYYEALAEEKNIRLICQGQGFLYADAQLFKRVLSNLLLNAIQHTQAGGEIRLVIGSTEKGAAEIRVEDEGCGIAAEHLPRLFDRFYCVDPARSELGTGLGLAIVKSIMDLHGGSVSVSSELGKGAVFSLRFSSHVAF